MKKRRINSKKKPWGKMEISKVALNPEQAVLSCCSNVGRGEVGGYGWQCFESPCGSPGMDIVSS